LRPRPLPTACSVSNRLSSYGQAVGPCARLDEATVRHAAVELRGAPWHHLRGEGAAIHQRVGLIHVQRPRTKMGGAALDGEARLCLGAAPLFHRSLTRSVRHDFARSVAHRFASASLLRPSTHKLSNSATAPLPLRCAAWWCYREWCMWVGDGDADAVSGPLGCSQWGSRSVVGVGLGAPWAMGWRSVGVGGADGVVSGWRTSLPLEW
jgi:hypothetical protein